MRILAFAAFAIILTPVVAALGLSQPTVPGLDDGTPVVSILPDAPASEVPEAAREAGEPYGVRFKCPENVISNPEGQAVVDAATCPIVLRDPEDLMAQPVLQIDPQKSRYIGFNALHGGMGLEPPPPLGVGLER